MTYRFTRHDEYNNFCFDELMRSCTLEAVNCCQSYIVLSVLEEGVLKVVNACKKEGDTDQAEAKAFVVPNSNNAKLRVQFFWPFRGDCWILELDDDYRWAVVGVPSRKYVWVLARSPQMDEQMMQMLFERIAAKGFDVTKIQRTVHDCRESG